MQNWIPIAFFMTIRGGLGWGEYKEKKTRTTKTINGHGLGGLWVGRGEEICFEEGLK